MKLWLASLLTLFLLSGFVFATLLLVFYLYGYVDFVLLILLTVAYNIIVWLISPKISDFIYRYFYQLRWVSLEELARKSAGAARVIREVCSKYNFKIPKLGIIPDKNPNAFTYGSGRWNARIVLTEGIFHYLDDGEIEAVIAHELGHIKNRDFIIMTIASTLLQLLYEIHYVLMRSVRDSKRGRESAYLSLLALLAYVFYIVGQYVILFLSRIREYYADEFSVKHVGANRLISALIKISYGILANPDNVRLVESTKFIGITNFREAKSLGLAFYNCKSVGDLKPLERIMLFDLYNPWAFLSELKSTHPLTARRIRRLCKLSPNPPFDFDRIAREARVDKGRMCRAFLKDVVVVLLPFCLASTLPVVAFLLFSFGFVSSLPQFFVLFVSLPMIGFGLSVLVQTLYRYSSKSLERSHVVSLLSNPYASPVKGSYVELEGEVVGRGIPGLIFSEDMMFKDDLNGLIFINYESWIPFLGNLLFGLEKVPKLVGKKARVRGWFLRGLHSRIDLEWIEGGGMKIRSFCKLGGMIGAFLLMGIGVGILSLFLLFPAV